MAAPPTTSNGKWAPTYIRPKATTTAAPFAANSPPPATSETAGPVAALFEIVLRAPTVRVAVPPVATPPPRPTAPADEAASLLPGMELPPHERRLGDDEQAYFLGLPATGKPDDRAGDISGWTPPVPNQGIPGRKERAKAEKDAAKREKAGR